MGGGASRGSKAGKSDAKAPGASGASGPGAPSLISPALLRRRKVLFQSAEPRKFESIPPRAQYAAVPEEADDCVFSRFVGGMQGANDLRRRAEAIQYYHDDGYLGEHCMELLGLGLVPGTVLSRRLFRVAQAQEVLPGPRRPQMTCYELLALYSVLKAGTVEELLELLFCVFDSDGDDKVGVEDLRLGIDAFLQLQEAGSGMSPQDFKDFGRLDDRVRRAEALRIAELAVKEYAMGSEDVQEGGEMKEADAPPGGQPLSAGQQPPKPRGSKPSSEDEDKDSNCSKGSAKSHASNLSMAPQAGDATATSKANEKDEVAARAKAKAKAKTKARAQGPLCCLFAPAGGKQLKPALSFQQWQQWLWESQLLPDAMVESLSMNSAVGVGAAPGVGVGGDRQPIAGLGAAAPGPAGNAADDARIIAMIAGPGAHREVGAVPPQSAIRPPADDETSDEEDDRPRAQQTMAKPLLASR
ncbi:unnamed protein product [Polarella glacialis]|uniref:EF-hand domain-containing protein n=1 Tax=Polarella glacialis TaxID=89957 RepID=A0A813JIE5_POLGL|nr:unnamed protein product [Polarella glacialis]